MRAAHALVLALAASLSLSPIAAEAQYTDEEGMTWGSVPSAAGVAWGRAEGVVDGTVEQVLGVVHDYASYHEFMPHFRASRVLSRRGDDALVYMEVGVARNTVTLWGQMRMVSRASEDRSRVVEATMMRGNMSQFRARWTLTPIDEGRRTRVDFRILVDPDMPLPASVFTDENVKAARKTLRALRLRLAA